MNTRKLVYLALVVAGGCGAGVLINRALSGLETPATRTETILPQRDLHGNQQDDRGDRFAGQSDGAGSVEGFHGEQNLERRSRKMYALVEKMDAAQIVSTLQNLQLRGLIGKEEMFATALIERWSEIDPKAALEYAQSILSRSERAFLLKAAAGTWAAQNSEAALDWAKSLPSGDLRANVLESVFLGAGHGEPESALKFLESLAPHEQNHLADAQGKIFGVWASENATAAAERLQALPPNNGRESAMVTVGMTWAESDPQAALNWTKQISDESTRGSTYYTALARWAAADPEATATYLLSLPLGQARDQAIGAAMAEMASRDSEDALKFVQRIPPGVYRDSTAHQLVSEMARTNPLGAASLAEGLPPGKLQEKAIQAVALNWGQNDVGGAVSWASKLSGQYRTDALRTILDGWSRDHSAEAAKSLLAEIPVRDQQGVISGIATSELTAKQRITWAQQMSDPNIRAGTIGNIVEGLASTDPAAAARLLKELPSQLQAPAVGEVLANWGKKDAVKAAAWASALPDGEMRSQAFVSLMEPWAELDPTAAAGWLEKLSAGSSRDSAVKVFARKVVDTDPESAALWAKSIGDPAARRTEMETACRRWLQLDADAATRWISQSSGVSVELRNELLGTRK